MREKALHHCLKKKEKERKRNGKLSGIISMSRMKSERMNVILRSEEADLTKNTTNCHSSSLSSSATLFFSVFFSKLFDSPYPFPWWKSLG